MNERRVAAMSDKRNRWHSQWLMSTLVLLAMYPTIFVEQGTARASGDNSEDKAEVIRVENKWLAALVAADTDTIAGILADDFLRPAPDSGLFVNKSELLSFYRSHLTAQNPNTKRMEDLTVTVYDSTALARGTLVTTDPKGQVISKTAIHRCIRETTWKMAGRFGAGE